MNNKKLEAHLIPKYPLPAAQLAGYFCCHPRDVAFSRKDLQRSLLACVDVLSSRSAPVRSSSLQSLSPSNGAIITFLFPFRSRKIQIWRNVITVDAKLVKLPFTFQLPSAKEICRTLQVCDGILFTFEKIPIFPNLPNPKNC